MWYYIDAGRGSPFKHSTFNHGKTIVLPLFHLQRKEKFYFEHPFFYHFNSPTLLDTTKKTFSFFIFSFAKPVFLLYNIK